MERSYTTERERRDNKNPRQNERIYRRCCEARNHHRPVETTESSRLGKFIKLPVWFEERWTWRAMLSSREFCPKRIIQWTMKESVYYRRIGRVKVIYFLNRNTVKGSVERFIDGYLFSLALEEGKKRWVALFPSKYRTSKAYKKQWKFQKKSIIYNICFWNSNFKMIYSFCNIVRN